MIIHSPRPVCHTCFRAGGTCYCPTIKRFGTSFSLVLVVHPKEARNRVGTVRIAHLSVDDSLMVVGHAQDIDADTRLDRFTKDPSYFPVVLFPGQDAINVDATSSEVSWIPPGKRLALFVVDATWNHAKAMVRYSKLLSSLPKVSFSATRTSEYRFRKQPAPYCLSTVEAVHTVIDRLDQAGVCPAPRGRAHDGMLEVFRDFVKFQVSFSPHL